VNFRKSSSDWFLVVNFLRAHVQNSNEALDHLDK
jgi:hypothetical protein